MSFSEFVFDVDEQNFSEVVLENSRRIPVLVDFWATWCAPCRMLALLLEKLAEEFSGSFIVAKVNTDEQRKLAAHYQIQSLPSVKIFRNETVVDEFLGAQPEEAIRQILDRYVERESDRIRAQAMTLHEQGDTESSLELLKKAHTADPANERVSLDLARLLLEQGQLAETKKTLNDLPRNRQMDADVVEINTRLKFLQITNDAPSVEELADRITKDPGDCDALYQLGARRVTENNYEAALEYFLEIMRRNRSFQNDGGRKGLIDTFTLMGDTNPTLISRYRSLMSSMLY